MYNQLTPAQQERLRVMEGVLHETLEVIRDITSQGFSPYHPYMSGPDNRGRLEARLGDINAMAVEMVKHGDIDDGEVLAHAHRRIQRIEEVRRQYSSPH